MLLTHAVFPKGLYHFFYFVSCYHSVARYDWYTFSSYFQFAWIILSWQQPYHQWRLSVCLHHDLHWWKGSQQHHVGTSNIWQAVLIIMMVADVLVPNRQQDINNHHADFNGTTVCRSLEALQIPGPRLNIKTIFPRYGDSHVKDKTVVRPSFLKHGDPYTGKTTSLYLDGPLVPWKHGPGLIFHWNLAK